MTKSNKDQFLDQLIPAVCNRIQASDYKTIDNFIRQFSINPTYEDLKKLPFERLVEGLAEMWEFIKYRSPGTPKIKVYYWKPDFVTPLSERIIINIINDDMPFLVDSIIELLHKHQLKARRIIHPVLKIKRDSQGSLTHIFSYQQKDIKEAAFESAIHCEIVENVSPELVPILERDIQVTLTHVRLATRDWKKMLIRTREIIQGTRAAFQHAQEKEDFEETVHFLNWLKEDHFTYLGYGAFNFNTKEGTLLRHLKAQDCLGILLDESLQDLGKIFKGISFNKQTRQHLLGPHPLIINKASVISLVHRGVALDAIGIKKFNEKGEITGIDLFVGLFTSIAYDSSTRDIPLLRRKVERILEYAGLSPNWHDGKALSHILDSLPRDDLFQASIAELTGIGMAILNLQERPRLALFIRRDQFNRFLSCLVYVPRDRFDSQLCEQIGQTLSQELNGRLSDYKAQFGSLVLARVHYILYFEGKIDEEVDVNALEQKLVILSRSWLDDFRLSLQSYYGEYTGAKIYKEYKSAFSKGYQEHFKGTEVIEDIEVLRDIQNSGELEARLYEVDASSKSNKELRLKVYHPKTAVPLSDILPILENLDLRIIKENFYSIRPTSIEDPLWIHDFKIESRSTHDSVSPLKMAERFLEAFYAAYKKVIEDDGFNRLVLRAGLTARQCLLLRVYSKYLRQLQFPFSRDYIEQTLLKYPSITSHIVTLFEQKFDPTIACENIAIRTKILEELEKVASPDEDKILRRYLNLVISSLRTNYYQRQEDGNFKPYISIKFDSHQIEEMPLPRPLYEIFVYSTHFEAIHLRGGKVARGGIRWSDRFEDFRTEILGLLKAQTVKNTVIVPVGSKGGFIVKSAQTHPSRDEITAEAIECYQDFMRGLLDITDNLNNGRLCKPSNVICYDGPDPYLVVAADKGTASFSDYANAISRQYKFWLDDAFASGGSAGYDHKKIAITARGAWESVKWHFLEEGIDISSTPFKVIGVGDMSGDVFGNGMLLSDQIKLIAAFNHQHIFIDPNPDPEISFQERQRLFELPRSTWKDYNPELISTGGGVFDRQSKFVSLSPEIQELLKIQAATLTPNELIKKLLTLEVDLLWFGGIGSFVKSSKESHSDVADRNNDLIRVNAKDLRCRVIGEGANLGVTQLGRIEFSQKGGRINTDAIDNSGGVDCSDHEVNIKILFSGLISRHELTFEERNLLLLEATSQVAELVLKNNYAQTRALSLLEAQGIKLLDEQIRLIRYLEWKGRLNRALEYLPDDNVLSDMQTTQKSLTRPELAVLMAYAKIDYYEEILSSPLLDDFALEKDLMGYFPLSFQNSYKEAILTHPLKREIIATLVVNDCVNYLGPSYPYEITHKIGCKIEDVFKAYLIVRNAFKLRELWQEIQSLEKDILPADQMKLILDTLMIVRRIVPWLLRHYRLNENILSTSSVLELGSESFLSNLDSCLDESHKKILEDNIFNYEKLNISSELAQRVAVLQIAASSPDIILIASRTHVPIPQVAKIYFDVGARFYLNTLRQRINQIKLVNSWQRMALNGCVEDLYTLQCDLVEEILKLAHPHDISSSDAFAAWISSRQTTIKKIDDLSKEILSLSSLDLAAVSVILREYRHL
jgi:glutamate dehydrogenase